MCETRMVWWLQKGGFNKGWAQNNWMPSAFAELLVQASAWEYSMYLFCYKIYSVLLAVGSSSEQQIAYALRPLYCWTEEMKLWSLWPACEGVIEHTLLGTSGNQARAQLSHTCQASIYSHTMLCILFVGDNREILMGWVFFDWMNCFCCLNKEKA